jgi:hypothetical protein
MPSIYALVRGDTRPCLSVQRQPRSTLVAQDTSRHHLAEPHGLCDKQADGGKNKKDKKRDDGKLLTAGLGLKQEGGDKLVLCVERTKAVGYY